MIDEGKIANIPIGKTLGFIRQHQTVLVRKLENGSYQIDAAWEVPEAYGDDPESYDYHPFKDTSGHYRTGVCWVGRRITTTDAREAAATYEAFKEAIITRTIPSRGEVIGSVRRNP